MRRIAAYVMGVAVLVVAGSALGGNKAVSIEHMVGLLQMDSQFLDNQSAPLFRRSA